MRFEVGGRWSKVEGHMLVIQMFIPVENSYERVRLLSRLTISLSVPPHHHDDSTALTTFPSTQNLLLERLKRLSAIDMCVVNRVFRTRDLLTLSMKPCKSECLLPSLITTDLSCFVYQNRIASIAIHQSISSHSAIGLRHKNDPWNDHSGAGVSFLGTYARILLGMSFLSFTDVSHIAAAYRLPFRLIHALAHDFRTHLSTVPCPFWANSSTIAPYGLKFKSFRKRTGIFQRDISKPGLYPKVNGTSRY